MNMTSETYGKQRSLRAQVPLVKKMALFALVVIGFLVARRLLFGGPDPESPEPDALGDKGEDQIHAPKAVIRGRVFEADHDEFDPAAQDEDVGAGDGGGGGGAAEQVAGCCTIYDLWQKNTDDFECSALEQDPKPLVCFYPESDPAHAINAQWDSEVLEKMMGLLSEAGEGTGLIDVGSKLGVFSLSAAAGGHSVLAVEPDGNSVQRFHKAVKLGRYESRVTLLHNAVSDSRAEILPLENKRWGDATPVKGILLDDFPAFCKFRKAILKIDLEGYESRAFRRASELFKEIQITYMFVNWDNLKAIEGVEKLFVDEMVTYMSKRGYVPRTIKGKVLSAAKWKQWPSTIYWHKM